MSGARASDRDRPWRVAVDTGGTFTDCVAWDSGGRRHRAKVLSSGRVRVVARPIEPPIEPPVSPAGGPPVGPAVGETAQGPVFEPLRSADRALAAAGFFHGWHLALPADGVVPGSGVAAESLVVSAGRDGEPALAVAGLGAKRPRSDLEPSECEPVELELWTGEEAAVVAVRLVTGTRLDARFPPLAVRLATTRGTNALLERKGSPAALVTTRGFADLLTIGTQQRPDLFALEIRKPESLHVATVEVDGRLDAQGRALDGLDREALMQAARELVASGVRSAAVALLHAYREPAAEREVAAVLRQAGFAYVARSSELSRRIKIVPRARTAVVDAYLASIVRDYLEGVAGTLAPRSLHVMTSAGGLTRSGDYRAKDCLLSGPAAGVVGAARVAREAAPSGSGVGRGAGGGNESRIAGESGRQDGSLRVLSFDMGGTSTDVSRYDGALAIRSETRVGDALLLSPSVAIETVAAGGGSRCWYDGAQLKVGPESAGALPGPACYGRGGPLTITDVNLLLGRLVPERFPFRVDPEAARARARELGVDAGHAAPDPALESDAGEPSSGPPSDVRPPSPLDAWLAGFLAIANERMAGAIRSISVREGYDPKDYALVAFGGAGAQHACAIAELLGITTVLVPADGALLSAVGLAAAAIERRVERQVLAPLAGFGSDLGRLRRSLDQEAAKELAAEGLADAAPGAHANGTVDWTDATAPAAETSAELFLRFAGQESTLAVTWREDSAEEDLLRGFLAAYRDLFGYLPANAENPGAVEIESARLVRRARAVFGDVGARPAGGSEPAASIADDSSPASPDPNPGTPPQARPFFDGRRWRSVPVHERADLSSERAVTGPCLVAEDHTVVVVETGWSAHRPPGGTVELTR